MRDADSVGGEALPALHDAVGIADFSLTIFFLLIVRGSSLQTLKPRVFSRSIMSGLKPRPTKRTSHINSVHGCCSSFRGKTSRVAEVSVVSRRACGGQAETATDKPVGGYGG
jgi:hypothetical protein